MKENGSVFVKRSGKKKTEKNPPVLELICNGLFQLSMDLNP